MPVSKSEGESLAKTIGAVTYAECSIQHHQTVKKVFSEVAQAALKYRKKKTNIVHKLLGR
jgi:hypothetical protein